MPTFSLFTSKTKGVFFILIAAFFFALMAVFIRLSGNIPFMQKSFFRNLIAFLVSAIMFAKQKIQNPNSIQLPKKAFSWLLVRSVAGSLGVFANFYAVDHLVLSNASILNKMSPFFAIIFGYFILRERVKPFQIIAIIIAFVGVLFIIKPSVNFLHSFPAIVGFTGGICGGLAYSCVRKLGFLGVGNSLVIAVFSGFSLIVSLPFVIAFFVPITIQQVLLLLCAGFCAAIGQYGITAAYFSTPAREISIYDYSQIIFSALFGYFIFSQIPDVLSIVGGIIIIGVAIFMYIKTNQLHKREQYGTCN